MNLPEQVLYLRRDVNQGEALTVSSKSAWHSRIPEELGDGIDRLANLKRGHRSTALGEKTVGNHSKVLGSVSLAIR